MTTRRRLWAGTGIVAVLAIGLGVALATEPAAGPSSPSTSTTFEVDEDAVLSAARHALWAWGRFAVSGDVAELTDNFHPDGPQYELLVEEASRLADRRLGNPPYQFLIVNPEIIIRHNEQIVRANVEMSRRGEATQRFHWDVVMRWVDDAWMLWTVEETPVER